MFRCAKKERIDFLPLLRYNFYKTISIVTAFGCFQTEKGGAIAAERKGLIKNLLKSETFLGFLGYIRV